METIEEELTKKLDLAGGEMIGTLVLEDGYEAASKHYVTTEVANAIGSAGHLKREIVTTLPEVKDADVDTIYMVKSGLSLTGDKYVEYMLIDGAFEQIGDTSVDLAPYMKKVEDAVENNFALFGENGALIDSRVSLQSAVEHIEDTDKHITADERIAWNEGAALAAENAEAIEGLVKISQDDANKLAALPTITEIGANLELTNGILSAVAEQYELPVAAADTLGGIKVGTGLAIESDGVLTVPVVEANGLSLTEDGLAFGLASETANGAMSKEAFIKLANLPANAAANVVEGMVLGANEVTVNINENKQLVLPFATASTPGVVVSSSKDNQIKVDETTGEMNINRLDVSKLFIADGDELILNGGNA